jgi:hypothetical protein
MQQKKWKNSAASASAEASKIRLKSYRLFSEKILYWKLLSYWTKTGFLKCCIFGQKFTKTEM